MKPRKITRDIVLFSCGLGGIAHETLISRVDRPYLLVLFAYMVGLPMVSIKEYKELVKEITTDAETTTS